MKVRWTEEQQKVIDLRNRNILVSAAAGSGKTAVLVERIIQMLTDTEHPLDVDCLLIVTFTEAAAAEMKERIRDRIEKKLEEDPGNAHLERQSALIYNAQITTIHSFCLSVIREHFCLIDLDPGFRIAEEGELKLLKQDVLEELLESCYAHGKPEFLELVEKMGSGSSDRKIEELILKLFEYSRSYPQPEKWLSQCAQNYQVSENPAIFKMAVRQAKICFSDMKEIIKKAIRICEEQDGPYMYAAMLESDLAFTEMLLKIGSFAELFEIVQKPKWARLSAKKDESVSADKKETVKKLREQVKKMLKDTSASFFYEEPDELLKDMDSAYGTMYTLAELVKEFADAFAGEKRRKNLIDFHDMEHFALQILTEEKDGELVPSRTAAEYQEQFREVMIDEYQDSNLIQEAILTSVSTVSRGRNNIFMVGDVKQSIYRFRLSRPELFMEKYDTYSLEDAPCQRIDLYKNFRSRAEVLDSVNFLFEKIMRRELGGILYDDRAALYPGAVFQETTEGKKASDFETELLLIQTEPGEKDSPAELAEKMEMTVEIPKPESGGRDSVKEQEAKAIARRIKALMKTMQVEDKAAGKLRPLAYRDIVILTRSLRGWADVFALVLTEEGIPANASGREGYFETYEVSVLLDYLKVLDNRRQDLPLASVLTSPFVGLNAQHLAQIRMAHPQGSFYEAVWAVLENAKEKEQLGEELKDRLEYFYRQTEYFREMVPYTAIHELLRKIIEETGYGLFICAMPGGEQRSANVEMLIEKAAVYEGTSYKGLFHFVRYIELLKKYDVDYGEASLSDEQSDSVRIMSIHKSKGLEFPVVFVAGMGKQFNRQDVTGSIVIHPELGVGIDVVDLEKRTKTPSFLKKVIQRAVQEENLGEELRVLYVALTRAKEKLLLTGTATQKEMETLTECQEELPYYMLSGAKKYMDWVLPVFRAENAPVKVMLWDPESMTEFEETEHIAGSLARDVLEHWDTEKVYDPILKDNLKAQEDFCYPWEQIRKMKMKFTVSELKKRAYLQEESGEILIEEAETVPLIPRFLQEEEILTGASRGSAYHKLLELLDFGRKYDIESLKTYVDALRADRKLTDDMAACICPEDILCFLNCKSGMRMHEAALQGRLYKEQPFVLGVDAGEIYPEEKSGEPILVQGIIDVYFEEDDGLVLLDYKTDHVRKAQELKEKYHAQLDYYAKALEQLLEKPVKEKVIYSFTLQEEILL